MRDRAPLQIQVGFIAVDAITVAQRYGHTVHFNERIGSIDTIRRALADLAASHGDRSCGIDAVLVSDEIKAV